jgi:hypothetical protein
VISPNTLTTPHSDVALIPTEATRNLFRKPKDLTIIRSAKWMTARRAAAHLGCETVEAHRKPRGAGPVHLRLPPGTNHGGLHYVVAGEFRATQHILDGPAQGAAKPMASYFGIFGGTLQDYLVVH